MPVILAHGAPATLSHAAWQQWSWPPFTIGLLLATAGLYGVGLARLYRRAGIGRGIRRREAAAFVLGLLAIAAALLTPVAWLSEQLFSAHMVQHSLLMIVAAPLLVLGRPLVAVLWGLPPAWRVALGRLMDRPAPLACWSALSAPLFVFVIYALTLWIWHVPAFYDAALDHEGLHILEHASFLVSATLFWWTMLHGRYGQFGYGVAVLYVFLTAMHSGVLGALITIQPTVMYAAYAQPAAVWQVDTLADKQLAGLLMWVPVGVVFIGLGMALMAAWVAESGRRVRG
jgi:cytochrome c oxidase assembly factor CtaG